jgi:hypothetical protein
MASFDDFLSRIEEFEAKLASPRDFFEPRLEHYLALAKRIAIETLRGMRPPETEAFTWKKRVEDIADRVTAVLMAGGDGILLSLNEQAGGEGELPVKEDRSRLQAVTFQDVEDWIVAGQQGEPGGKRITSEDEEVLRKRGVHGVAATVMKAYYSSEPRANYERLRQAIQRYLMGRNNDPANPMFEALRVAWLEAFSVIVLADLRAWVDAEAKKLNGFRVRV